MPNKKEGTTPFDPSVRMWLKFIRAYSAYKKQAVEDVKKYGLNMSQYWVIECLGSLGPQLMGELSKKTFLTAGNMTFIVDGLEKTGLVERDLTHDDRRAVLVRLTPKGECAYKRSVGGHSTFLAKQAAILTDEEQAEFARMLKKLGLGLSKI